MKNKNKRVNLFFFSILLAAGFFGSGINASARIANVVINELLINGPTGEEFIELYNPSTEKIALKDFFFNYYSSTRDWGNPYRSKPFPTTAEIGAHSFFVIGLQGFASANWQPYTTDQLSNSSGSIAIFPNNTFTEKNAVDFVSWGKVNFVGKDDALTVPPVGKSLEKTEDESWQESYAISGTPGKKNFTADDAPPPPPPPVTYSDTIRINELLPKPDPKNVAYSEEFVELYNPGDTAEKLDGWFLQDRIGKICKLDKKTIEPAAFLVLKNDATEKCALALNDTTGEFLGLYNPGSTAPVYAVEYVGSAKEGLSYNFDSAGWRWSKFLTPGEENLFNNLPIISASKDNEIYVNTYAAFSANGSDADKDTLKYTWDFGDGHKSYLPKTRHKYEKTGRYTATLKVTDGSEDVLTTYAIDVIEFPKLKIKIVALSPNPDGKDNGIEYITLKNETKKKVDLKGWSIATGWKKMINHPIREKFEIKKGKTKNLTAKYSSLTLNNTKSKIELRNPAGKVIDKIKYENKEGVPENALYTKTKKEWQWDETDTPTKIEATTTSTAPQSAAAAEIAPPVIPETELQANLGKVSFDPQWQKKQFNKNILTIHPSSLKIPESQGRVLGAATVRTDDNFYAFTSPTPPEKHWAMKIFDDTWTVFNILLNKFFDALG